MNELIDSYGLQVVLAYMNHIQMNAEHQVRDFLKRVALEKGITLSAEDWMDDGSVISLEITIDDETGDASFDFTGTSEEVFGNWNSPKSITFSAVVYSLRAMIRHDVPLNDGFMAPIKIIWPKYHSIISPSGTAAVVGGNVLTSQRITDIIFKAFEACAASQGCMNNWTIGDDTFGYYETVAGGAGK